MLKYRCPALGALAVQLRRGPSRLRLRQLLNIEFLLTVVEPGRSLPFDFLQNGVTGVRPRRAEESTEPLLVSASNARADLVTLAEDLSGDLELHETPVIDRFYSLHALAERFGVSTKTIFRWHRRGLVGWRLRGEDRRARLVFPDRCVRRFVAENAELVSRGRGFSQLSSAERDRIIERAQGLVALGQRTANAIARIIAGETGRAIETIRLILKSYDAAHPQRGILNRPALAVETDDSRMQIWEAHCDGCSLQGIAERFERSPAEISTVLTEMRARELKAREIEFVPSDEFAVLAADEMLDSPAVREPYQPATARRMPGELPAYLQELFRQPLLTPVGEAALFRKLNYLRFRADEARRAIVPEQATDGELDEVERLLEQATEVKRAITQANLRLVVSIAKKHARPGQDFFELVSDGNVSLMRAVDRFDYSRGFKFSTYASWAIMKNFARSVPEQRVQAERYQTGREEVLEVAPAATMDAHEDEALRAARTKIDGMLAVLAPREQEILRQRFGLDGAGAAQTLEQIGKRLGVSKERIRQLESRAITRLRSDFPAFAGAGLPG